MPADPTAQTFSHGQPDGSVVVFERTGECCRCGECCMTGDPFAGTMGEAEIVGACPLLRREPDGLYSCGDRTNVYYLNGPNVWPTHPLQIVDYPSCTYRFARVDGD